jgi:hypothetical protein
LHRVTSSELELKAADRVAATFFFQPNLDSLLTPFPPPLSSLIINNNNLNNNNMIIINEEETPTPKSNSTFCSGDEEGDSGSSESKNVKTKKNKKRGVGSATATTPITYGKWKSKAYGSYFKGK